MPEGQPPPKEPEEESLDDAAPAAASETPTPAAPVSGDSKDAKKEAAKAEKASKNQDPTKKGGIGKIKHSRNLYLYIYALVIILAGLIVAITFIINKQPKPKTVTTKSLTSAQLSQLQGPTTLVGDAKQTLDIQSNTVFEGSILSRGNVDIAGTLKLGGALSLPSITVTGAGSVGQFSVGGTLGVAGDVTLQGQVTLQKNLTVQGSGSFSGALSAGTLSVTNLSLTGDFTVARHIVGSGGSPGKSNGTALGGGGSAGISGSDTAGTVSISTGSSPPAGCFVTVNFAVKFGSTPHVVISASNSSAGSLDYYTNRSTTGFSICTANAPTAATAYSFDYIVVQ
jgi:cytoskeletal protein CcmA (bactofilin family)